MACLRAIFKKQNKQKQKPNSVFGVLTKHIRNLNFLAGWLSRLPDKQTKHTQFFTNQKVLHYLSFHYGSVKHTQTQSGLSTQQPRINSLHPF